MTSKGRPQKIYPLFGQGFSGRGVRIVELTGAEKDEAYQSAAVQAGDDSRRFFSFRIREGVKRMLVSVTDVGVHEADLRKAKWHPVTLQALETSGDKMSFDRDPASGDGLFTAKDADALGNIFLKLHEAGQAEIDAILGKAILVSPEE